MAGAATPASQRPPVLSEETIKAYDGRRSTFHTFPQFLFPSDLKALNDTSSSLETPYVYSHHQAAFYWTREDAQSALIWNFPSRPPCLNCVLSGEVVAKRCDRMERQWRSQGHVRCCKQCDETGNRHACVEMVEIRVFPHFVSLLPSGKVFRPRFNEYGVDMLLWTDEERALRKQGRVVWRPLNLEVDDVGTKKKLAADFAAGGAGDITRFSINPGLLQQEMPSSEVQVWTRAQRMMKRKISRWDREEAEAKSEWATLLGGMTQVQARSASTDFEKAVVLQLDAPEDKKENQQSQYQAQLSVGVEAQSERWRCAFRRIRQEQYERDVEDLGTFEAHRNDGRWNVDGPKVMRGIQDFFKEKQSLLKRGRKREMDEVEAEEYACWESGRILEREARDLIEEFMPGMFLPVDTKGVVEMQ